MFENVGAKLQLVAKFIFMIRLFLSILIGFYVITVGNESPFFTYFNISPVLAAIIVILSGAFSGLISTMLIYAFGVITETNEFLVDQHSDSSFLLTRLKRIEDRISEKNQN